MSTAPLWFAYLLCVVKSYNPAPSEHSMTTVADKNLYIFGGVMNGVVGNDLAILNTGGLKTWTDTKARGAPPPPRKGHSSTIIQNNNKDHLIMCVFE